MIEVRFDSASGDGKVSVGYIFPVADPVATIQICHGMAEHIGRYEGFISYMNDRGIACCGIDMQGHGKSYMANKDPLGYFGDDKDTFKTFVDDNLSFYRIVEERTGKAPDILYGHSMGSFVARMMYSDPRCRDLYASYIFSSTIGPEPLAGFGIFLTRIMWLIGAKEHPGKLINLIAFGTYNKRVKNRRTNFDWVNSDPDEVDAYIKDPLCGFMFTNKGYYDLLRLVKEIQSGKTYDNLAKAPCLFLFGTEDPVGGYGKGVRKVMRRFGSHGVRPEYKDFGPVRHELMRESVKDDYLKTVEGFVRKTI